MKILCIKDVITRDYQTGKLDKDKSFTKDNIYETYPFRGKTELYANDDTNTMHCLSDLNEDGTLKDEDSWFEEHFKVIFK